MNSLKIKGAYLKNADLKGFTIARQRCMLWFFDYPDSEMSLNDLSIKLGISKTTARKTVLQLESEGFLARKELGKTWRISCNHSHPYNSTIKISTHLDMIYRTELINEIHRMLPNARAVMLFGSYRKGDDNETSDIDLAAEIISDKGLFIQEIGVIPRLGYRKNVKVNLHIFSRKKVDPNLFANIANGIVLSGFLEVKP